MTGTDELRRQVADLVQTATSGAVPVGDALAPDAALFDLGLDSLGWLRLIDAMETTYGLDLDLDGVDLRDATIDTLVARVHAAV